MSLCNSLHNDPAIRHTSRLGNWIRSHTNRQSSTVQIRLVVVVQVWDEVLVSVLALALAVVAAACRTSHNYLCSVLSSTLGLSYTLPTKPNLGIWSRTDCRLCNLQQAAL